MPVNLKTGWETIGRTGKTVDGREITEQMVKDAVDLYDTNQYTAVVWPDHYRYYKMGTVEALRLVANDEKGFDVQAILRPNEYWLYENASDQRTFTSMELDKLDKFGGRYYLTGLGATDQPASFGTSQLRFNKKDHPDRLQAEPIEFSLDIKTEDKGLLSKLFSRNKPEDSVVDKETIKALLDSVKALSDEFAAFKEKQKPENQTETVDKSEFAKLEEKFNALDNKFSQMQGDDKKNNDEKLASFQKRLDDLTNQFTEALKTPHPGTSNPPSDQGDGGDNGEKFPLADFV